MKHQTIAGVARTKAVRASAIGSQVFSMPEAEPPLWLVILTWLLVFAAIRDLLKDKDKDKDDAPVTPS